MPGGELLRDGRSYPCQPPTTFAVLTEAAERSATARSPGNLYGGLGDRAVASDSLLNATGGNCRRCWPVEGSQRVVDRPLWLKAGGVVAPLRLAGMGKSAAADGDSMVFQTDERMCPAATEDPHRQANFWFAAVLHGVDTVSGIPSTYLGCTADW